MATYAVIGLGRFGSVLARTLGQSGADVIAIDSNREYVEAMREYVSVAVRMDATDPKALAAQGIGKVDVAVVCIGEDFEGSVLATVLLKQLPIKKVIARATTEVRTRVLEAVGADEVINAEEESARRLAQRLTAPHVIEYVQLAEGHSLIQVKAPKKFHNRSLFEIDLRKKYEVNLIAIKRRKVTADAQGKETVGESINDVPKATDVIEPEDILFLVGSDENISKLPSD